MINEAGRIAGVVVEDHESGERWALRSHCVINATGVWVDSVRRMDQAPRGDLVAPSQGAHIVVDRAFLPDRHAILVPRTRDGRVLFAVPWLGKTLLGTTDTPRHDLVMEPEPFREEIAFILGEAGRYLRNAPTRADIRPREERARGAWIPLAASSRAMDRVAETRTDTRDQCSGLRRLRRTHPAGRRPLHVKAAGATHPMASSAPPRDW